MRKFYYVIILLLTGFTAHSQVGINILIPDSSAALQVESSTRGLAFPRLTTVQRDAITNPLKGLTIFNTTDSLLEYWNGECWLKAYEKNCYECDFTLSLDDATDTLDRLVGDSVYSTITVKRTHGNSKITVMGIVSLPAGITLHFNGATTVDSTNSLQVVVKAETCSPSGGTFDIILQAICDDKIRFVPYKVHVVAPKQFNIPADEVNYNMQVANGLPAGSSQFALLTVGNGVKVSSADPAIPAFTTGNIAPNSIVCITNFGHILGRGGDGGAINLSGGFTTGGESGKQGGDGMHLTARTFLQNYGVIYGGGSGGGSVGVAVTTPTIPVINLQLAIGAAYCGGGGSELGLGGKVTGSGAVTLGAFKDGTDATCCVNSVPGVGGFDNYPIVLSYSVASIELTPSAHGGDGAPYGQQGQPGYLDLTIDVCVSIPFIGKVCIGIPLPGLPFNGPTSFPPGVAIKRNSNPLVGIADGNYNITPIRGAVVP